MMFDFLNLINWTALLGLLPLAWTIFQYNDNKRREQDLKEFENYHRLLKELVQPDDEKEQVMYHDRQGAIIYEFRHFKRYYPFSLRTLKGLLLKWEKSPTESMSRLLEELKLTIAFLEQKIK